jgi:hypothetical protein
MHEKRWRERERLGAGRLSASSGHCLKKLADVSGQLWWEPGPNKVLPVDEGREHVSDAHGEGREETDEMHCPMAGSDRGTKGGTVSVIMQGGSSWRRRRRRLSLRRVVLASCCQALAGVAEAGHWRNGKWISGADPEKWHHGPARKFVTHPKEMARDIFWEFVELLTPQDKEGRHQYAPPIWMFTLVFLSATALVFYCVLEGLQRRSVAQFERMRESEIARRNLATARSTKTIKMPTAKSTNRSLHSSSAAKSLGAGAHARRRPGKPGVDGLGGGGVGVSSGVGDWKAAGGGSGHGNDGEELRAGRGGRRFSLPAIPEYGGGGARKSDPKKH